jgi:hypothetical protein
LVESLVASGATEEELGLIWAWCLLAAFGERGNLLEADPGVVAALQLIMEDWPLADDLWWSRLWGGLKESSDMEAVALRVAIYEALNGVLPKEQWLSRMASLSKLEDNSAVGGFSLLGMGDALVRHTSEEEYFSLFLDESQGGEWNRAIVFGYPGELCWPSVGFAAVPNEVFAKISRMLDSESYLFGAEILGRQWQLLGPTLAAEDLERFVFRSDPLSKEWDFKAGARIGAAVSAAMKYSPFEGDSEVIEHARGLVRDLLIGTSPKDSLRILAVLRDRGVIPSDNAKAKEWREELAAILGPEGLMAMDSEFRAWLGTP